MTENPEIPIDGQPSAVNQAIAGGVETLNALQVGFDGNPTIKLDDRNRLKMPSEFRTFIDLKYGKNFNAFYITSQDGESAEIYPLPIWHQRLARIQSLPNSNSIRMKLTKLNNLYGGRSDMDSQGRMSFPEELQKKAELTGEVKVLGEGSFLRVTSVKKLKESVENDPLTHEELDGLSKMGL